MTALEPNADEDPFRDDSVEWTFAVRSLVDDDFEVDLDVDAAESKEANRQFVSESEWFGVIVAQSTDAIAVCTRGLDVTFGNSAWHTLLERAAAHDLRELVATAVHPDEHDEFARFQHAVASIRSAPTSIDVRLRVYDRWRWYRALVTNLVDDSNGRGFVLNLRDITEPKRAALLQEALAAFSLVSASCDSVEPLLHAARSAACAALDLPPESLTTIDTGWPDVALSRAVELTSLRAEGILDDEPRLSAAERHYLETMGQMITSAEDRLAAQTELRYQARHDLLTGLANRALLDERLDKSLEVARANGSSVAVYLLDLDAFKLINDSLGHGSGDAILRKIGFRLRHAVRSSDTVARFGGDEFVVSALVESNAEAMSLAQRMQACFDTPISIEGLEYFVTASIGVSQSGPEAQTSAVLLRSADAAMHTAKSRGRGCLTVFTAAMHAQSSRHVDVHRRLRAAIENRQVRVHYQPVIELRSNHIVGVEALARWTDPDLGQIAPTEFIGIAEESGLIVPLDRHLVELAVQDISRLERRHPLVDLTLAVNVSAKELTLPGYTESLRATLATCGFDPTKLVVELTETSLVADPYNALQSIKALRNFGTKVAIDDFGTGFSSLQTLRDYPIDFLKIDSSFISGADSKENWAIVASVISLANSVGAKAVAEGVETVPQLQALRRLRCEHAQGFYWAPSMPIDELNAWIEANDRRTHRARTRR